MLGRIAERDATGGDHCSGLLESRSALLVKLISRKLCVPENLRKKTRTDSFPAVNGNNSRTAIRMPKEAMTSALAYHFEPQSLQCTDDLLPGERGIATHAGIDTR